MPQNVQIIYLMGLLHDGLHYNTSYIPTCSKHLIVVDNKTKKDDGSRTLQVEVFVDLYFYILSAAYLR
jgi:hypothetical protein